MKIEYFLNIEACLLSPIPPSVTLVDVQSFLYVFTHSLTRFIDLFWGLASQRLMGAHLIVVQQILLQFVPKLC